MWGLANNLLTALGAGNESDGVAPSSPAALDAGVLDLDGVIYKSFILHHSPADDKFPFPYLNPKDFNYAVMDLVRLLQPGGTKRVRVPAEAVQRVANAADVNGDGVVQWAEYYFAAKALAEMFSD